MPVIPLVQAVHAACVSDASRGVVRRVSALALVVSAPAPVGPDDLLKPRVSVRTSVHPYAETHLNRVGKRLKNGAWSVSTADENTALAVFSDGSFRTGVDGPADVLVTRRTRRTLIEIRTTGGEALMRYDDAEALITTSRLQVFDASLGELTAWRALRDSSVIARCQPGSPNLARIVGADRTERIVAANEAVRLLAESGQAVACEPVVAGMAELAAAESIDDELLTPAQRAVAGAHLQSSSGVVCAMPPGSGKTAVAAAVIGRSLGTSLVVIPSGLEHQWVTELSRFAPHTAVTVVRSAADAKLAVNVNDPSVRTLSRAVLVPIRLLATPAFSAPDEHYSNVVFDEAAYLCRDSLRTQAAWSVRNVARRVLLLTGTPARRKISDLGALVAYVLDDRRFFHGAPLQQDWAERVGPLVQGADDTAALPATTRQLLRCVPGPTESALLTTAMTALTAARAALAQAEALALPGKERNKLRYLAQAAFERARLAGTDPSGMTGDLAELAAHATSAKRDALLQMCQDGTPTVVCCDSARVAEALSAFLHDGGITSAYITGSLGRDDQERAAASLGNSVNVLVVAAAGQQGWNLQAATRLVHYDVPLTAAVARQREGRVRRFGGRESVAVCLLLEGAVDTDSALAWASSKADSAGL